MYQASWLLYWGVYCKSACAQPQSLRLLSYWLQSLLSSTASVLITKLFLECQGYLKSQYYFASNAFIHSYVYFVCLYLWLVLESFWTHSAGWESLDNFMYCSVEWSWTDACKEKELIYQCRVTAYLTYHCRAEDCPCILPRSYCRDEVTLPQTHRNTMFLFSWFAKVASVLPKSPRRKALAQLRFTIYDKLPLQYQTYHRTKEKLKKRACSSRKLHISIPCCRMKFGNLQNSSHTSLFSSARRMGVQKNCNVSRRVDRIVVQIFVKQNHINQYPSHNNPAKCTIRRIYQCCSLRHA